SVSPHASVVVIRCARFSASRKRKFQGNPRVMAYPSRTCMNFFCLIALALGGLPAVAADAVFNIREYGAKGDGAALDTASINQAIAACAESGGGQVLLPPGRYISGTVLLKSHVTLYLD